MIDLPRDLPIVERIAVRLVVLDAADRILLFHTHDPTYPELGTWWELPGGGREGAESPVETAIRELREETGFVVGADRIGPPNWRRDSSFRYRGKRHLQHEMIVTARLDLPAPDVDGSQRMDFEDEDYFDFRWWTQSEIVSSTEAFYPGRLPALLPGFLAGDQIDEPFELWS
jgi:8-oxo-dGTP pyrophosphatase MutT (NUDIX family)